MEENNRVADTWRLKNRAMSIDNININLAGMEQHYQQIQFQQKQQQLQLGNKENHVDPKGADQDQEHGVGIGSGVGNANSGVIGGQELIDPSEGSQGRAEEEEDNIIPWRAQLRKTNSRLSLI